MQSSQSTQYWDKAEYIGPVLAKNPDAVEMPTTAESSKETLEQYGTTAIARCKPTNSVADVATFLAEFVSDGLPKVAGAALWKERTKAARLHKTGSEEYLNLEFGLKPMIADVTDIVNGVRHAQAVLRQYERGSGSLVRRRYDFPASYFVDWRDEPLGAFMLQDDPSFRLPGRRAVCVSKYEIHRKIWFSGAFTYHLPTGFHSRNAIERIGAKADALLGTGLTPETIWNAAPWSWAVDWFSNAGDVVSNLSSIAIDGLVIQYGYVMEHCSATRTYNCYDQGIPTESGYPCIIGLQSLLQWKRSSGRRLHHLGSAFLTELCRYVRKPSSQLWVFQDTGLDEVCQLC